MRASEQFRMYVNGPIPYIINFFSKHYLGDIPYKTLKEFIKEIKTGKTPSKKISRYWDKEEYPWFRPEDVGFDIYLQDSSAKISILALKEKQATIYQTGTLLITAIGDIGRLGILKNEASSNQQITGILFNQKMLPEYAYFSLLAMNKILYMKSSSTTLHILNQKRMLTIKLKAPNIEIQKKFVAFLKYLFECLRQGEVPSKKDFDLDDSLIKLAIKAFEIYYSQNKLSSLHFECREYIKNLRQAILQDAVSGNLVPQNPDDEHASELVKEIKVQKEKLLREKKIKRQKKLSAITEEEIPYVLPPGWYWTRWQNITKWITYGFTKPMPHVDSGVPIITAKNIINNKVVLADSDLTSEQAFSTLNPKDIPKEGDILVTKDGSIGRCAIVTRELGKICVSQSVAVLWLKDIHMNKEYLALVIESPLLQEEFLKKKQGVAVPHISVTHFGNMLVPIPPLPEQERIVQKVNCLIKFCNELEEKLMEREKDSKLLMETVLEET